MEKRADEYVKVKTVNSSSDIRFLFVGRLVYYKGCDVLIRATVSYTHLPGENSASNTSQEGWEQFGDTWKYKLSDGSYVTNAWKQDTDGKWYYFGGDSLMVTSQTTPDGYHVDKDGVWVENE